MASTLFPAVASFDDSVMNPPSDPFPPVEDLEEEEDTVPSGDTRYTTFEDLNLPKELLKGLYVEMKYERPSKIQLMSLPMILNPPYDNQIVQGYCGSGKSTCFLMGALSRIDPTEAVTQVLCICPTKDLAKQTMELLFKMSKYTSITAELGIPNKADYVPIAKRSPVTSQVIIGTAGTINKLIAGKKLDTSRLKTLIFDDADHMLLIEGGSKDDSVRIMMDIHEKNPECKVLMYTSIFNDRVKKFVCKIVEVLKVEQYTQLFVKKDGPALDLVKEYKVNVLDELSKIDFVIEKIVELGNFAQTIIFVRSQKSAQMLHKALLDADHAVTNFHGARTQEDKDLILKEYKNGLTQHLITTDVHARGFNLGQADVVVNYDLPTPSGSTDDDSELYVHRIGRVGRCHRRGTVFNLLGGSADNNLMEKIEKYNKIKIAEVPLEISAEQFADIFGGH